MGEVNELGVPVNGSIQGTYVCFYRLPPKPKTDQWRVDTKDGLAALGTIQWHGPWRKYAFFPHGATFYEQVCLREIAQFVERLTEAHKAGR